MRIIIYAFICLTVLGACGSADNSVADEPADDSTDANATPADSFPDADPGKEETTAGSAEDPAIAGGEVTTGQVTIDGTAIEYVVVVPEGFEVGDTAPFLLAMPPGPQSLELATDVLEGTYAKEAIARGWVVLSPVAPDGVLYHEGSEALIPGLLEWSESWASFESDAPYLAGISNGGASAFRLAALEPDRFQSIVAFPGYPNSDDDKAALSELTDVPIRLFVGELDTEDVPLIEETAVTLEDLGGDVTLEVLEGEEHVIESLSDGVRIFDELDALR